MTFAITGANGFLGVHIIHHLLKEGHTIRAIHRLQSSKSEFEMVKGYYCLDPEVYSNLSWCECELFDVIGLEEIFSEVDYVMHLAGVISYLKKDYINLLNVNQGHTENVINAALRTGVKKLLYCSSIAAISKNSNGHLITEDVEWDNEISHSNYGYSKYLGECELWRSKEEGLATVAINPGIVLGFGDYNKGSNKLFRNALSGFPFYSNGITGWVGVEDVSKIALKLCLSDVSGERYILVSENKSFKEVAYTMADTLKTKNPKVEVKGAIYKIVYWAIALKEFLKFGGMLSKETVKASISINRFDNSKVTKALDFKFESITAVIEKACAFYSKINSSR